MSLPDDFQDAATEQMQLTIRNNELVATQGQVLSFALQQAMSDGKPYYFSSLPAETLEQKRTKVKLMVLSGNDIELIMEPNYFDVVNVMITKASWTDENGETVIVPKCVLLDASNQAICVLAGVWVKQFVQLFAELGIPPWNDPVRVSAKEVKMKGGRRYYSLVLP